MIKLPYVIKDCLNSERSVELLFLKEYITNIPFNCSCLDVGGIYQQNETVREIMDLINYKEISYKVSDFRGGDYKGDFVEIEIPETFDHIFFISSIEHFPQCTEGDMKYRPGHDKKGFDKAYSLLSKKGRILITVPMGDPVWQNYHQNYDIDLIKELVSPGKIEYQGIYRLSNDGWLLSNSHEIKHIKYTDRCYAVGCFIIK